MFAQASHSTLVDRQVHHLIGRRGSNGAKDNETERSTDEASVQLKHLLPATCSDKSEERLTWNTDIKDSLETQILGARDMVTRAVDAEGDASRTWAANKKEGERRRDRHLESCLHNTSGTSRKGRPRSALAIIRVKSSRLGSVTDDTRTSGHVALCCRQHLVHLRHQLPKTSETKVHFPYLLLLLIADVLGSGRFEVKLMCSSLFPVHLCFGTRQQTPQALDLIHVCPESVAVHAVGMELAVLVFQLLQLSCSSLKLRVSGGILSGLCYGILLQFLQMLRLPFEKGRLFSQRSQHDGGREGTKYHLDSAQMLTTAGLLHVRWKLWRQHRGTILHPHPTAGTPRVFKLVVCSEGSIVRTLGWCGTRASRRKPQHVEKQVCRVLTPMLHQRPIFHPHHPSVSPACSLRLPQLPSSLLLLLSFCSPSLRPSLPLSSSSFLFSSSSSSAASRHGLECETCAPQCSAHLAHCLAEQRKWFRSISAKRLH